MQGIKSYLKFLLERYEKTDIYEYLEQYEDNPDIYLHFTYTQKIGINVQTEYDDTPLGIYSYPIKYVTDSNFNLPLRHDAKYIYIIEGYCTQMEDYNYESKFYDIVRRFESDFERYFDERSYQYFADYVLNYYERNTLEYSKAIWKFIEILSGMESGIKYDPLDFNSLVTYTKPNITKWRKMLIQVKMNYIEDSFGIIHSNEPVQTYFSDIKQFDVKDMILNKDYV